MSRDRISGVAHSFTFALALFGASAPVHAATVRHVAYTADDSDFPNPERGFSRSKGSGSAARAAGLTLVHVYFRLDPYRSAPLPPAYLDQVRRRFAEARASGVKLVPRFTYNFPEGDFDPKIDKDAPLQRVLEHLDQLAPVLRANADVIAFMEAGFIGAWGEWHDSTSGLDELAAKRAILMRLLQILPQMRDVALRYERDKRAIFGRDSPINLREAFSGSPVSRVGHHNDCFLASTDDLGTYAPTKEGPISAAKAYLEAENRFVPQGGETCADDAAAQPYIGCTNALGTLAAQHWSQLNADYRRGVLDLWKREGCYTEVSRRLGYRFRLLSSSYPGSVKAGRPLRATITIVNEGFAAPYNPRELELVLRSRGAPDVRLEIRDDPRRWEPGRPIELKLAFKLPAQIRAGNYEAFLALPDPEPRLRSRPEYAIRFANSGAWQPRTGDNALGWRIDVH